MMDYEKALEFIFSRRKFQKSPGLERIEALLSLLGSPQKKLRFVHIVGTNGKGSVSVMCSKILEKAGYKSGLFTSPFVTDFRERIQINSEYINKEALIEIVSDIKEKCEILEKEEIYPTVFEVTTALGLCYFSREECDIVFLEAGIGGEHDSTNVIPAPLLCIFMPVSLDHTEMLGETVEEIAKEKSGIIKKGSTVISFPVNTEALGFGGQNEAAFKIIKSKAEALGCEFFSPFYDDIKITERDAFSSQFTYKNLKLKINQAGIFQIGNAAVSLKAADALRKFGYSISDEDMEKGIFEFFIPGRTEKLSDSPLVIIDGGHNEQAVRSLKSFLEENFKNKNITLLLSFMKDKSYETCIKLLSPLAEKIVFTEIDSLRSEKADRLSFLAKDYCENCFSYSDPEKAFEKAFSLTEKDGVLVVGGSFYLASFVRKKFKK